MPECCKGSWVRAPGQPGVWLEAPDHGGEGATADGVGMSNTKRGTCEQSFRLRSPWAPKRPGSCRAASREIGRAIYLEDEGQERKAVNKWREVFGERMPLL